MTKIRKTIQVSESAFNEFQDVKSDLKAHNSSDALTQLMQRELIKTSTSIISTNKMLNRLEAIGDLIKNMKNKLRR